MSIFHTRWSTHPRFTAFTTPRRPRHPILRIVLGVVGLAMLAMGMLWRLWKQRGKPLAARANSIDGDYRVVGKAQLPLAH